jgi:hypothetical protein
MAHRCCCQTCPVCTYGAPLLLPKQDLSVLIAHRCCCQNMYNLYLWRTDVVAKPSLICTYGAPLLLSKHVLAVCMAHRCYCQTTVSPVGAGIFKKSMGARNRGGIGFRSGPPGYIGWRNSFLGINSWAP